MYPSTMMGWGPFASKLLVIRIAIFHCNWEPFFLYNGFNWTHLRIFSHIIDRVSYICVKDILKWGKTAIQLQWNCEILVTGSLKWIDTRYITNHCAFYLRPKSRQQVLKAFCSNIYTVTFYPCHLRRKAVNTLFLQLLDVQHCTVV